MPHELQGEELQGEGLQDDVHVLTTTHLRLKEILKKLCEMYGGWLPLQKAMAKAGFPVSRLKLADICAGVKPAISLTMVQMQNLNSFLHKLHLPGLESIFRTRSLAATIAQTGAIHFWEAAKPEPATENQHAQTWISHWDEESVSSLVQGLCVDAPGKLELRFNRVLLEQQDPLEENWVSHLQRRPWYATLHDQAQRHSIIAVGSPKACHVTECLLSMMFGVRGFERNASVRDLPFRFEYSPRLMKSRPSAFACEAETPPPFGAQFDTYALEFGSLRYEVKFNQPSWDDYGVIVSQRRAGGQVWTVLAGLSGPATSAAAKMASAVQHDFCGKVDADGNSPVFCRAVTAKVERDNRIPDGDNRVVRTMGFVGEPILWPPEEPVVAPNGSGRREPGPKKPR